MQLVQPSVALISRDESLPLGVSLFKKVEQCGRIAYKSEQLTTDISYEKFVKMLVTRKHLSVTEHARITVSFQIDSQTASDVLTEASRHLLHRYMTAELVLDPLTVKITGNLRAWYEWVKTLICYSQNLSSLGMFINYHLHEVFPIMFPVEDLPMTDVFEGLTCSDISEATDYSTVHIVTDRGVLAEVTRHRNDVSFTVESTRYCNYSNKGMTFCLPLPVYWSPNENSNEAAWMHERLTKSGMITKNSEVINKDGEKENSFEFCANGMSFNYMMQIAGGAKVQAIWEMHMRHCETVYNEMIDLGVKPQFARSILPNSLKTEIIMTATTSAWNHFFELRCAEDAHPQCRYIADKIKAILIPPTE